ncbi:MAG TPA: hypothetical protein PL064_07715, partial [Thermogutta sp.]|nr:hypothetical protein [Thermogutta sp.]
QGVTRLSPRGLVHSYSRRCKLVVWYVRCAFTIFLFEVASALRPPIVQTRGGGYALKKRSDLACPLFDTIVT